MPNTSQTYMLLLKCVATAGMLSEYPNHGYKLAALLCCTPVDRASDYDGPDLKLFISVSWLWMEHLRLLLCPSGLRLLQIFHVAV